MKMKFIYTPAIKENEVDLMALSSMHANQYGIVFINEKEFGPYSQAYITHNENEWGLLMNYNNKWYVNINGKAFGPYLEKPTVEFYGENIGFSYIKDNKYYVNLNSQIYGPYDDLIEFNLNEK